MVFSQLLIVIDLPCQSLDERQKVFIVFCIDTVALLHMTFDIHETSMGVQLIEVRVVTELLLPEELMESSCKARLGQNLGVY